MFKISLNLPDHIPPTFQTALYYRKSLIIVMVNDGDLSIDEARQFFEDNPGETTFEEFWHNAMSMATKGPNTKELRKELDLDIEEPSPIKAIATSYNDPIPQIEEIVRRCNTGRLGTNARLFAESRLTMVKEIHNAIDENGQRGPTNKQIAELEDIYDATQVWLMSFDEVVSAAQRGDLRLKRN
jgi:hypothetical protein